MLSVPDAVHCLAAPSRPLTLQRERVTNAAAGGGGGGEGGRGVGGKEGGREEERVISQTSVVNHFTPSGSVRQGKKKACVAWPSLHRKVHWQACVTAPLLCSPRLRLPSTADRERREAEHGARRQQVSDDVQYATAAPANKLGD
ncbi:hypothetical protein CRENBAI_009657 [Crenichthys baileyi]|uniref:Uncharacterized protein n=1 Tax=Crenichthys baileyi TaxID=28760 RepID=A0AAV9RFT9_9TELE